MMMKCNNRQQPDLSLYNRLAQAQSTLLILFRLS
jgi:hypothetical protein